jgi:protein-S-isoprenylcysteine O-methyltransferase Ste14
MSENQKIMLKWFRATLIGMLIIGLLLFIAAGRMDWLWGWVYLLSYLVIGIVTWLVVDPDLLQERLTRRHADQKPWDRVWLGIYGTLESMALPLAAGLQIRLQGMPETPLALSILALILYALGWSVHIWALAVNKYHSMVVRIQADRGQRVISDGPYRFVRHPGYVGGILIALAAPLVLGSSWAFVVGVMSAVLLVVRTVLEERTLLDELEGYRDYTQRVRYRLLPGIW